MNNSFPYFPSCHKSLLNCNPLPTAQLQGEWRTERVEIASPNAKPVRLSVLKKPFTTSPTLNKLSLTKYSVVIALEAVALVAVGTLYIDLLFIVMFLRRASLMLHKSKRLFSTHDIASTIDELNKEMEFVFGEAPPTSLTGSKESQPLTNDSESPPVSKTENESNLTHINVKGEAQMVDVSHKDITKRIAIAKCKVILGKKVYDLVSANQVEKGDVLSVAKIAGIVGAKQTSNLIPLCHNINITHVRVDLRLSPCDYCVEIEGEAASTGKTGVEMEAMTAVTVAGLTVYDMCKAASKDIRITDVRLEQKSGGKSGDWTREKS